MTILQTISEECRAVAQALEGDVLRLEGPERIGSALAWTETGLVVSSASLLETSARRRYADTASVRTASGEAADARVIMIDPGIDLAVLETGGSSASWRPASVPRTGDLLLSMGRPGKSLRMVMGMASAVSPDPWRTPAGGNLAFYVEVDGSLPEGVWGGPLVDAGGRVVAMNTGAMPKGQGMSVPTDTIAAALEEFRRGVTTRRFYLGVNALPVPAPRGGVADRETALMITEVEAESPAEEAGLLPGDVLFDLGSRPLLTYGDLVSALTDKSGSDRLERSVAVWRSGSLTEKNVSLRPRA